MNDQISESTKSHIVGKQRSGKNPIGSNNIRFRAEFRKKILPLTARVWHFACFKQEGSEPWLTIGWSPKWNTFFSPRRDGKNLRFFWGCFSTEQCHGSDRICTAPLSFFENHRTMIAMLPLGISGTPSTCHRAWDFTPTLPPHHHPRRGEGSTPLLRAHPAAPAAVLHPGCLSTHTAGRGTGRVLTTTYTGQLPLRGFKRHPKGADFSHIL